LNINDRADVICFLREYLDRKQRLRTSLPQKAVELRFVMGFQLLLNLLCLFDFELG